MLDDPPATKKNSDSFLPGMTPLLGIMVPEQGEDGEVMLPYAIMNSEGDTGKASLGQQSEDWTNRASSLALVSLVGTDRFAASCMSMEESIFMNSLAGPEPSNSEASASTAQVSLSLRDKYKFHWRRARCSFLLMIFAVGILNFFVAYGPIFKSAKMANDADSNGCCK